MLEDIALIASSYLLSISFGLPVASLLRGVRYRYLTAPIFGYALLGVLTTLLYHIGVAIRIQYLFACFSAILILLLYGIRISKSSYSAWCKKNLTSTNLLIMAGWFAATCLIMLPAWSGGRIFAVFQGNHWDDLNYTISAVVYSKEPYSAVRYSGVDQWIQNPLWTIANLEISGRPTVSVLFALLGQIAPQSIFKLGYAFEAFLLSNSFGALLFLNTNVFRRNIKTGMSILVSLAFVLGFWGQYIFDINAWSQASATPLLILFVTFLFLILQSASGDSSKSTPGAYPSAAPRSPALKNLFPMSVLVACAVYFYAESLIFHLGVVVIMVLSMLLKSANRRAFVKPAAALAVVAMIGFAGAAFFYDGTLKHLGDEATAVRGPNYVQYFDGFFGGRSGHDPFTIDFSGIADGVAGLFGLYVLTPARDCIFWLAAADRTVVLAVCLLLLAASGTVIFRSGNRQGVQLTLLVAIGLCCCLTICLTGHPWMAGKGVSFLAPYLVLFLLAPLLTGTTRRNAWLKIPALLLLSVQLTMGLYRPIATAMSPTRHYELPYPASQDATIKETCDWNTDRIRIKDRAFSLCWIDVPNLWLRYYLMMFLYCHNRQFYQSEPVKAYYIEGRTLGVQPMSVKPDSKLQIAPPRGVDYAGARPLSLTAIPSTFR